MRTEREQFANFRDKNHDGHLDKEEIREWIIPEDYDHSSAEAAHLMRSSDEDGVGRNTGTTVALALTTPTLGPL